MHFNYFSYYLEQSEREHDEATKALNNHLRKINETERRMAQGNLEERKCQYSIENLSWSIRQLDCIVDELEEFQQTQSRVQEDVLHFQMYTSKINNKFKVNCCCELRQ